jgi:uncharacterized protein YjbI with pentapeptide repeats
MLESVRKSHRRHKVLRCAAVGLGGLLLAAAAPLASAPPASAHGCNIVDHPTATAHMECEGEEIGWNLDGQNLSFADFRGAVFVGQAKHLKGTILQCANFGRAVKGAKKRAGEPADLRNVVFENVNLRGATLTDALLGGSTLIGPNFDGAVDPPTWWWWAL